MISKPQFGMSVNKCLTEGVGLFLVFFCLFFLPACSDNKVLAPVVERSHSLVAPTNQYRVRSGDTLYSIAWAYDLDYRELAAINRLDAPYLIAVGQLLQLKGLPAQQQPLTVPVSIPRQQVIEHWRWPAIGKITQYFSIKPLGNKGIDISGVLESPIYAAAGGIVVYSGAGLRGYGNLLIVKHNQHYLSAYAFNWRNLVKEGDRVNSGQQIATMGRDDSGQVLLHFEIRCNGKPLDPLNYLY